MAQQLAGREGTPSTEMRQAELAEIVREALAVLNEDQKLAVLLNKFEEMSYAEIADVMGRSPAAVKSLLARARNQLRERLEPYLLTGQHNSAEIAKKVATKLHAWCAEHFTFRDRLLFDAILRAIFWTGYGTTNGFLLADWPD